MVFFRFGLLMGVVLGCTVHEGEKEVVRFGLGKYYVVVVEFGMHEYFIEGEVKDKLIFEVEGDEIYFVKCKIGMGVMSGCVNLLLLD